MSTATTKTSPPHHLSSLKVIISGAGISGLSLAIALRKQWPSSKSSPPPSIKIYERESHSDIVERQGYSLSLRSDPPSGGIQALIKLGILDKMVEASISGVKEGGGFTLWDKEWNKILKVKNKSPEGSSVGSIRIARNKLRGVLIGCAEELGQEIEWGVGCTGVKEREDGKLEVTLSNGDTDTCDILVAADGASSKIRAQLRPDDPLQYAGVNCMTGTTRFPSSPPKPIDQDWGIILCGTGTAGFASPVDANSALWSLSYPSPTKREAMKQPIPSTEVYELLKEAEERSTRGGLPQMFTDLIKDTDPATLFIFPAMDKNPFAHAPSSLNPKVLYIGDANHAVSPFAGNGANMALMDGWDLAEQLIKADSFEKGVKAYDRIALPRSKKILKQSHVAINVAHSTGFWYWFYTALLRCVRFLFLRDR
jgi:2-polyprenyl-6-methoxyphenol hydroxylase-like FAD-dependent oxidoreductase